MGTGGVVGMGRFDCSAMMSLRWARRCAEPKASPPLLHAVLRSSHARPTTRMRICSLSSATLRVSASFCSALSTAASVFRQRGCEQVQ
eukprot:scaffold60128_cov78-Phaeocystis_antarctica.AAC.1